MTLSQALFVKWLRTRQEGSWSWIRRMYHRRYNQKLPFNEIYDESDPSFKINPHGMELCDDAMKLLNEKIEDGWN